MNIRKTRKFKEKPTILPFGHIMLPLVGLLALGLLVLGIRLLFVTPGSKVQYPESSAQTVSEPVSDIPNDPVVENEISQGQVVAVPVRDEQETTVNPPASIQATPKVTPQKDTPAVKQIASKKAVPLSSGVWVVQIGAFITKDSAEALARDARGKGYEAFVVKAEVGGKTYFRVRIGTGKQRSDAENLASDLAGKGYPTLLARQE